MTGARFRFERSLATAALLAFALSAGLAATEKRVGPEVAPEDLAPGEWVWTPELSPSGPVVVLVSLTDQLAYVYRNGVRIGYTNVSTGRPGYDTPTGVFTILQKDADHVSSTYHAKMPYTERLTWSGVALHAGGLPGYPESHGCVHLPLEFSRLLFEINHLGNTVVIADDHGGPKEALHPGMLLSPVVEDSMTEGPMAALKAFEWAPDRSPEGPVSMVLSAADQKLYVYRNGVEIGVSDIRLKDPDVPIGEGVFVVLEGRSETDNPWVEGEKLHRWMSVEADLSGLSAEQEERDLAERLHIPPYFAKEVFDVLEPGATLVVTNRPAAPHVSDESDFVLLATEQAPTPEA